MKKLNTFILIAIAALICSCLNDSDSSSNLTYSTIDTDIPLTVSRYYGGDDEEGDSDTDTDTETPETPEVEGEGGTEGEGNTEGEGEDTEGEGAEDEGDTEVETRSESEEEESEQSGNVADQYTSFPAYSITTFDYIITSNITSATVKSVTMIGENSDRFLLTRHPTNDWRFSVTTTDINDTYETITGTIYVTANNVKGGLSYNIMQLSAASRPTARYITIVPYVLTNSTDTVEWNQYGESSEQTLLATVNNGTQSELKTLELQDNDDGYFEVMSSDVETGLITIRTTSQNDSGKERTATIYAALDPDSEETKGEFITSKLTFTHAPYISPVTPPSFKSIDTTPLEFAIGYKAGQTGTKQFVVDPGMYTLALSDFEYDTNEGYTIKFTKATAANTYNVTVTVSDIAVAYANNVYSDTYLYINYVDEYDMPQCVRSEEKINITFFKR
ncbi:MAG: hypothetical protein SNH79_01675 [Rikenellaceae bacterium]